jgi:taurine dioxygenase
MPSPIDVTPLSRWIGAHIDGVDLRNLDDDQFAAIDEALLAHHVLFFRDQDLSAEDQQAFASRWGQLAVFPVAAALGSDTTITEIEDTAESPPDADDWHTDVTWIERPPKLAVLAGLDIPESGGDTMWASLHWAYDQLSPVMASICEGLSVRHHRGAGFDAVAERLMGPELVAKLEAAYPAVVHPLVRSHPVTGRPALFVTEGFIDQIVGMHRAESDVLLGHLRSLVADPNGQVRWSWKAGDVAVWDETCTNHRALGDHFPQHRRMRRCTVEGERPVFNAA